MRYFSIFALGLALLCPLAARQSVAQQSQSDRAAELVRVRKLLDKGRDVNKPTENADDDTLLGDAVIFGYPEVVKLLLKREANPNARNNKGQTALWLAAEAPLSDSNHDDPPAGPTPVQRKAWTATYVTMMRDLLAGGADPNTSDKTGLSPLGVAAWLGRTEQTRVLLDAGANPNVRDRFGRTPLEWAVYYGHDALADLLRARGARVGAEHPLPKSGQRALDQQLHDAIGYPSEKSEQPKVKALLQRGADPNSVLRNYQPDEAPQEIISLQTPLLWASDKPAIVRLLLKRGADPNIPDDRGQMPLMSASLEVARLLLDAGAKVRARDNDGETALMNSADDAAKIRLLVARGAQVKARDNEGRSALLSCHNSAALKTLLAYGADINAADNRGRTALMESAQQGYGEGGVTSDPDWARALLRHGADPNRRDHKGRTALMILSTPFGEATSDAEYYQPAKRVEFAQMLLGRGARLDLRDNAGRTATQIARASGAKRLSRLLGRAQS